MSHHTTVAVGSVGGSGWWVIQQLIEHGPSWQVIPPMLFGVAAVFGAVRSYQDGSQKRRHAEADHQARLRRLEQVARYRHRGLGPPEVDPLPDRS